jgi:trehalose 6-phosphate synthase/phosphatase
MGSLTVEDGDEVLPTTMTPLTMDDFEGILSKYIGTSFKLALLLDYDGTLAPIAPHPDLATIPPETKKVRYGIFSATVDLLKCVRHWYNLM